MSSFFKHYYDDNQVVIITTLINFDDDSEEASKITLSSIEREKRPLELMCSDYNQDITVNFLTHHK